MDNNSAKLVGGPCGQHGPYTFYKAFKYSKNGVERIVTLSEFFFVKLWIDSDLVCIGELQLLWVDKNSEQVLTSLRLYFLPEHTPEGRMDHGEDEVLAISEKVVLRLEDLVTWITVDADWTWGRLATTPSCLEEKDIQIKALRAADSTLDFTDVEKEKSLLDPKCSNSTSVVVLSYPRYCRYRAVMQGVEGLGNESIQENILRALGGFAVNSKNTRILFCRDTFDYPELEGHELLCNHLAPKLKGRPRGKRKKRRSISPGSESNESESSVSNVFTPSKFKDSAIDPSMPSTSTASPRRSTRSTDNTENKVFIKNLTIFMKARQTPIGRIPSLGYKELDLFAFYMKVQKLGGYDAVTTNRLWKSLFDDLSGNHNSTSAATVIRRHYERFLLPYERYEKGEEYKPLPVSERRRLKSKQGSTSTSDAETSEGTSRSGNTTPVPCATSSHAIPGTSVDYKESFEDQKMKTEIKPSSLRSVRVKPERLRENTLKDKINSYQELVNIKLPLDTNPINDETKEEFKPSPLSPNSLPEKNTEPVMTAIAPIQKLPEKSTSPAEGKENIPILNANEASNAESSDSDLIEVPYKPKTPEIIDLESDTYKNITSNSLQSHSLLVDVKKKKLDILKEGGLEVTPVRPFAIPAPPVDARPSVIQPPSIQIGSVTVTADKRSMPPPLINPALAKRTNITGKSNKYSPVTKAQQFTFVNGSSPPKVYQSNSIYAPSEKVTYGDPKDFSQQAINYPKFTGNKHSGDVLDLTCKTPQKPIFEIVRVPTVPTIPPAHTNTNNIYKGQGLPLLDGRKVGSNLEITLVSPNKSQPSTPYLAYKQHSPVTNNRSYNSSNKLTQKRNMNERSPMAKVPRIEENGRTHLPNSLYPSPAKENGNGLEISVPNPYLNRNGPSKIDTNNKPQPKPQQIPNSKHYPPTAPSNLFVNYLPHMSPPANKNISPYHPMLDAVSQYYALQNLYSPNHLAGVPPLLPTQEQLQFYTELIAHTSRVRFPYPFTQDSSFNSSAMNNIKKQ